MRPLDFEEDKKYPTILQIHGGPVRHYGYNYFHEFQILVARGYAVIYGNPRGVRATVRPSVRPSRAITEIGITATLCNLWTVPRHGSVLSM